DANPTWSEIEGEPDLEKREARKRECKIAIDELVKIYREHEKRGTLHTLDIRVRLICGQLKTRNAGQFPPPLNTGKPPDLHHRLLFAVHVREEIEALGGKHGAVKAALEAVAKRENVSFEHLRDIHYDRDREWRNIVAAELGRRKRDAGRGELSPIDPGTAT